MTVYAQPQLCGRQHITAVQQSHPSFNVLLCTRHESQGKSNHNSDWKTTAAEGATAFSVEGLKLRIWSQGHVEGDKLRHSTKVRVCTIHIQTENQSFYIKANQPLTLSQKVWTEIFPLDWPSNHTIHREQLYWGRHGRKVPLKYIWFQYQTTKKGKCHFDMTSLLLSQS